MSSHLSRLTSYSAPPLSRILLSSVIIALTRRTDRGEKYLGEAPAVNYGLSAIPFMLRWETDTVSSYFVYYVIAVKVSSCAPSFHYFLSSLHLVLDNISIIYFRFNSPVRYFNNAIIILEIFKKNSTTHLLTFYIS